jgi:hypothetical protein
VRQQGVAQWKVEIDGMAAERSGHGLAVVNRSLVTQRVGLPPPLQSEQFCSVTVIDGVYVNFRNKQLSK